MALYPPSGFSMLASTSGSSTIPYLAGAFLLAVLALVRFFLGGRKDESGRMAINDGGDDAYDLPDGPPSSSWLFGNTRELVLGEYGLNASRWITEYGPVHRIKGCFGETRLLVSDPLTISAMIKDTYSFPRAKEHRFLGLMLLGKGLLSVQGTTHKKQRAMLQPAFTPGVTQLLIPKFYDTARALVHEWSSLIQTPNLRPSDEVAKPMATIDIYAWMHRASLDTIGHALFDHDFGSLRDSSDPVAQSYHGILEEFMARGPVSILSEASLRYMPTWMLPVVSRLPTSIMKKVRRNRILTHKLAKELIDSQAQLLNKGDERSKTLIGQLASMNNELLSDGSTTMSLEEIYDQLFTFLIAGGEAGALSVTWSLYQLCLQPEYQIKIRQEANEVRQRGGDLISMTELEKMSFTTAFIKEVFRLYATAPTALREANRDVLLPISQISPLNKRHQMTKSQVLVRKGTVVIMNLEGYNRLEAVWGPTAKTFDPYRWLDGRTKGQFASQGLYANLMTFYGGPGGCIGWRFAIFELQVFLIELLRHFSFSLPSDIQIRRELCGGLMPFVVRRDDVVSDSASLPLYVALVEEE